MGNLLAPYYGGTFRKSQIPRSFPWIGKHFNPHRPVEVDATIYDSVGKFCPDKLSSSIICFAGSSESRKRRRRRLDGAPSDRGSEQGKPVMHQLPDLASSSRLGLALSVHLDKFSQQSHLLIAHKNDPINISTLIDPSRPMPHYRSKMSARCEKNFNPHQPVGADATSLER